MLIGLDLDGAEVVGSLVSLLVSNELAGPVSVKSLLYPLVMQLLLLVECDDNLDSDDADLLLQLSSGQSSLLAVFVEASWILWTFVELLVSLVVSNELSGPVSVQSLLYPLVSQLLLLLECDDNSDFDDADLLLQLFNRQSSLLTMFVEAELGMASWFLWTFVELLSHSLNFVILAMSDTIFVCFISSVFVEFDISLLLRSISLFQRSNFF